MVQSYEIAVLDLTLLSKLGIFWVAHLRHLAFLFKIVSFHILKVHVSLSLIESTLAF